MPPSPGCRIIQDCIEDFCTAVDKSLRLGSSKGQSSRIKFRHDVYRYLFRDNYSLHLADFNATNHFNEGWDQNVKLYKKRYSGVKIIFPIEIKLYIAWTGGGGHFLCNTNRGQHFQQKKRKPVEIMKLSIVKQNFSGART